MTSRKTVDSDAVSFCVDNGLFDSEDEWSDEMYQLRREIYAQADKFLASLNEEHPQRKTNKRRRFQYAHNNIMNEYFGKDSPYDDAEFRRKFGMRRSLFMSMAKAVEKKDPYFIQRRDAARRLGISPLVKITAAIRQLTDDGTGESLEQQLEMSTQTATDCMKNFCSAIIGLYEADYFIIPSQQDMGRLRDIKADNDSPGYAARGWGPKTFVQIMKTCIILHNLVVEDEREEELDHEGISENHPDNLRCTNFIQTYIAIRDNDTHNSLSWDLLDK